MTATLIDGQQIASRIFDRAKEEAAALRRAGVTPGLGALLVGGDSASRRYASAQQTQAKALGFEFRLIELAEGSVTSDAVREIHSLNADASVHGILAFQPFPKSVDAFAVQSAIAPEKDVEGAGAANLGMLAIGQEALIPCTAAAALACLQSIQTDLRGKRAVVVGRSAIVGKPVAMLLLAADATVTQCHSKTRDLALHTRSAEILMVAVGVPELIGVEHVSPGAIVIDVGIHRVPVVGPDGRPAKKSVGDVRFEEVVPIASAITPVPGGVGPVTVAMLMANVVTACRRQTSQGGGAAK